MTDGAQRARRRRPIWVWVISGFYLLSAGWTFLSFTLISSGTIQLNSAQEAYFASLTSVDWLVALSISFIGLTGAIALFLLRRLAVVLFLVALVLNLLLTALQTIRTNWMGVLGGSGLFGVLLVWGTLVTVILYARGLAKRGVLF